MPDKLDMEGVEAACKAYIDTVPGLSGHHPAHITIVKPRVQAAIAAYLSAREAKGWREMPREPTPEMREAIGACAAKLNPAMKGDDWKAVALDGLSMYRAAHDAAAGGGDG